MQHRWACLLVVAVLTGGSGRGQDSPVFRSDVALVHLDAEVVSSQGRVIGGLRATDFVISDENQIQTVTGFLAEEQPLDLILLFDVSRSMRPLIEEVTVTADQALEELRPEDRVAVVTFDTGTHTVVPFTSDLRAVKQGLEDVLAEAFNGGTKIQEAVSSAARMFWRERASQRRRAILIVTDNVGLRTRRERTILHDLWEADCILSGIILDHTPSKATRALITILAPQTRLQVAGMEGLAEKTGGDVIRPRDSRTALGDMMRRLRTRYSLYYPVPKVESTGKPIDRRVKVTLTKEAKARNPEAEIRVRQGYRILPN